MAKAKPVKATDILSRIRSRKPSRGGPGCITCKIQGELREQIDEVGRAWNAGELVGVEKRAVLDELAALGYEHQVQTLFRHIERCLKQ